MLDDEAASRIRLCNLTLVSAARLGQTNISPVLESALLEVLLSRWNRHFIWATRNYTVTDARGIDMPKLHAI